jgi:hypothetical protein
MNLCHSEGNYFTRQPTLMYKSWLTNKGDALHDEIFILLIINRLTIKRHCAHAKA